MVGRNDVVMRLRVLVADGAPVIVGFEALLVGTAKATFKVSPTVEVATVSLPLLLEEVGGAELEPEELELELGDVSPIGF